MPSKKTTVQTAKAQSQAAASPTDVSKKTHGMIYWLMAVSVILPFTFSRATLDPALSIRYLILCGFVVAFCLYFFLLKKVAIDFPLPKLVKALFVVGGCFLLWNIVAAFLAINSSETFFETSRIWTNLAFLFIVLFSVYKEKSNVLALFKVLTLAALAHSVVGICQYYGLEFTDIPGNYAPYGFMTNRNLYGSALVLMLPFCLYVLFAASRPWKYLSGLTITALITAILLSQTRAAWLATLAIVLVSLVLVLAFAPAYRKTWLAGTGAGILLVALVYFIALSTNAKLATSLTERAASLAPVSKGSDSTFAASTANERLVIWKKTGQLIGDHGVTGVGPGNWRVGIQAYGNHGLINAYGHFVLDHAHNIYLQIASEAGVPGLVLFLAFWVLLAWIAYQTIRKTPEQKDKVLVALMLAGVAAFAIDGLFSFPLERIEHTYYLFLLAGIILGYYSHLKEEKEASYTVPKQLKAALLAASVFALYLSIARFDFDKHFYRVKAFNNAGQSQDVINEVEAGRSSFASLESIGDPLEMYSGIAYKNLKQYDEALRELDRAMKLHPYSARIFNTLGTVYTEKQDFQKSIIYYEKALATTPKYDVALKNLAISYYYTGEYKKCVALLNEPSIASDTTMIKIRQSAQYLMETKGVR